MNEYYRIRQTNSGFYLLNFEREMNQVFDAKNDLTSSAKINLGINSSTYVNCTSDEKGIYILSIRGHCGVLAAVHRHLQGYFHSGVRKLILSEKIMMPITLR